MFKNTLLLLLALFFTTAVAIQHRTCRKLKNGRTQTNCDIIEEKLIDNHIPETICSAIPHPKLIINPYKDINKYDVLKPKNVTALCLRCGACLAVADKIKSVVIGTIEAEPSYDPLELAQILKQKAEAVCENSFKNYDLRRYGDDIVVTNTLPATTHIASDLDFKWPIILKKTCQLYVEKIDFLKWFENYVFGTLNVPDKLCRGEGVFRECKNVNYHYVVLGDGYDYLAMCTCRCLSKDHIF